MSEGMPSPGPDASAPASIPEIEDLRAETEILNREAEATEDEGRDEELPEEDTETEEIETEDGDGTIPPGLATAGPETIVDDEKSIEDLKYEFDMARKEFLVARTERGRWFRGGISERRYKGLEEIYKKTSEAYQRAEREQKLTEARAEAGGELTEEESQKIERGILIQQQEDELRLINQYEVAYAGHSPEKEQGILRKINSWVAKHPRTAIFAGVAIGVVGPGIATPLSFALIGMGSYRMLEKHIPHSPPQARMDYSDEMRQNDEEPPSEGYERRLEAIAENVSRLFERSRVMGREIDKDEFDKEMFEKAMYYQREILGGYLKAAQESGASDEDLRAIVLRERATVFGNTGDRISKKRRNSIMQAVAGTAIGFVVAFV